LELQPAVYTDGWEWYRLIAFNERDIKNLFKDLEKSSEKIEII
jgi:predicted DNA binding protein